MRSTHVTAVSVTVSAATLALAACQSFNDAPPTGPERPLLRRTLIAQVSDQGRPVFVVCPQEDCPHPTAKTRPAIAPAPSSPPPSLAPSGRSRVPSALPSSAVASAAEALPGAGITPAPVAATGPVQHRLTLHFASGSATLGHTGRSRLAQAQESLSRATAVHVAGFTDDTGSVAVNDRLARHRVDAVASALLASGMDRGMPLTSSAQGRCCYLDPRHTPDARQINRRVELRWESQHAPAAGTAPDQGVTPTSASSPIGGERSTP